MSTVKKPCRLVSLLLLLALLLSGCAQEQSGEPALTFYYAVAPESGAVDQVLDTESLPLPRGEEPLAFVLRSLGRTPDLGYHQNLLTGSTVEDWTLENGLLTVSFTGTYGELDGLDLTLADACAVLTLCAVPGVERVRLLFEGEVPPLREDRTLSADDLVTDPLSLQPMEQSITVWFPDEDLGLLWPESRMIIVRENEQIEKYVLDELRAGPRVSSHAALLEEESALVLSISREQELCYVNLSGASLAGFHGSFRREWMTLSSIALSLLSTGETQGIQFLVDGNFVDQYCCVPIKAPLRLEDFTSELGVTAAGDLVVQEIYYPAPQDAAFVAVPRQVQVREGVSQERLALEALLTGSVPFWCSVDPIPQGAKIRSFRVEDGLCTVEFSEEFFLNHLATAQGERRTVGCVLATLLQFDTIDRVQIQIEDSPDRPFVSINLKDPLEGAWLTYVE